MKRIHVMRKSISRYLTDIDLHYEDIIKELEYRDFANIMETYNKKLEFFGMEVEAMLLR